jgi:hypothetical protein
MTIGALAAEGDAGNRRCFLMRRREDAKWFDAAMLSFRVLRAFA